MKNLGFSDMKVEERLFVNGRHLRGKQPFCPTARRHRQRHRWYLACSLRLPRIRLPMPAPTCALRCRDGKGQLVVTLFARAVHAGGSLYVEWEYYVLAPLKDWFQRVGPHLVIARAQRMWGRACEVLGK